MGAPDQESEILIHRQWWQLLSWISILLQDLGVFRADPYGTLEDSSSLNPAQRLI